MEIRNTHNRYSGMDRQKQNRRLCFEPLESRQLLAVVTVNTELDVIDFNDGVTSLREAIFAANIVAGADEIVFDFGHDGPVNIFLQEGELEITESLTISANGPELLTIDAGQISRIFNITATTGDYVVAGMTLTGGKTAGFDSSLPVTHFNGGAIRSLTTGSLTIDNCRVFSNSTYGVQADGGGIFAEGDVIVTSSTILDNSIRFSGSGGGISAAGSVTITESSIAGNSSYKQGGGIRAAGDVFIRYSSISGNSASDGSGGGVYAGGDLTVTTSEVRGNSVLFDDWGGICALGDVLVSDSTIAESERGGIRGNEVTATSSMIVGNSGDGISAVGDVTVTDSTILGNNGSGIRGGNITVASSKVSENGPSFDSWGIYGLGGVTVSNSAINRNGGTSYFSGGGGIFAQGDISVDHSTVSENGGQGIRGNAVTVNYSTIAGNSAGYYEDGGGGVYASADVTIFSSTLSGNTAYYDGGGIFARGDVLVQNSQIYQNSADLGDGGGIWGQGVTVSSSQIWGNTSQRYRGGGIYASGDATISSSTISSNVAKGGSFRQGAGLYAYGNVTILDSTISRNEFNSASFVTGGIGISAHGDVSAIRSTVSENITGNSNISDASGVWSDGDVFVEDSTITGNHGNGILGKNVTIKSSEISDNSRAGANGDTTTIVSSGITGNRGGGVSGGTVTVSDSTISNNLSNFSGGGISGGIVTVVSSTISGNSTNHFITRDNGGGIYAAESVVIHSSTISGNSAKGSGGGIASRVGNIAVTSSTLSGNTADLGGGGGIYTLFGEVNLISSTLSGNSAALDGGGIMGNRVKVVQSTITENHGYYATLTGGGIRARSVEEPIIISGSIIAGNTAGGGKPDLSPASGAVSAEYSLIGDAQGLLLSGTNMLIGVDPTLGPLAANGGLTWTHALLPGSPAIDAGDPEFVGPPNEDQRGSPFHRVANGISGEIPAAKIDMGAYEAQAPPSADFDSDGDVDGRDFLAWQRGLGKTNAVRTDGNSDDDRDVDASDLAAWQVSFGQPQMPPPPVLAAPLSDRTPLSAELVDLTLTVEWPENYPIEATEIQRTVALLDAGFAGPPTILEPDGTIRGIREYNVPGATEENPKGEELDEPWISDNMLETTCGKSLPMKRHFVAWRSPW